MLDKGAARLSLWKLDDRSSEIMSRWLPVLAGLLVVVALGSLFSSRFLPVSYGLSSASTAFQNQPFMTLTSSAFKDGERIPVKYTCDGPDVSPPLDWTQAPNQTKTFVLILEDPNANGFTHWVIFNIPATLTALQENIPGTGNLPNSSIIQGMNDFGAVGYNGPCPPSGTHHYVFHLYGLDTALTLSPGATKRSVSAAMKGHVLGQVDLTGLYR